MGDPHPLRLDLVLTTAGPQVQRTTVVVSPVDDSTERALGKILDDGVALDLWLVTEHWTVFIDWTVHLDANALVEKGTRGIPANRGYRLQYIVVQQGPARTLCIS